MSLKYISRVVALCFMLALLVPMAIAEVLYENPMTKQRARDLQDASLQELLGQAEQRPVDESAYKAQYLLGLVYMNGWDSWGVERDFEKARRYLQEAWEHGVLDAGIPLASMYFKANGVGDDSEVALSYLERSASEGYVLAQRSLGLAYLEEEWEGLVEQDIAKAISWFEEAANAGDLESARQLAEMYHNGELVEQDFEAAFYWTRKSAESKFGSNTLNFTWLARYYEEGVGTEQDLVQAYKYHDLTGTAGVDDKKRLAQEMTQEQIDEAIRQSRAWQEEHRIFVPSY